MILFKKSVRRNYRIEVIPTVDPIYCIPDIEAKSRRRAAKMNTIIQSIKRHVDDIASVNLVYDEQTVCAFCGEDWIPPYVDGFDDPYYCCDKLEQYLSALKYAAPLYVVSPRGGNYREGIK